jgi:hydroxymethylglutaryl-CoA reductase
VLSRPDESKAQGDRAQAAHATGETQSHELRTSRIPRFYRLPVEQRLAVLQRQFNLSNDEVALLRQGNALRIVHAVNMVENAIGVLGQPLGLALNFLVDGREHIVPMAIEEASIIAAASKAALTVREGGGFTTEADPPVMIGQVQILDLTDAHAAAQAVLANQQQVLDAANAPNQRMVARGGGCFDVEARVLEGGAGVGPMLIVHLLMDVREAMGANAINYSCEAAGPVLAALTGGRVNLRILSNYATKRLARARFSLPLELLASAGLDGAQVAQRLIEASAFAQADPYRAVTHNKGIFNGIGAAALALGQDWRALEAGGHAWAARSGQYRGLAWYALDGDRLTGEIELPMQVGWHGGAVASHPGVRLLRRISGIANARELAGVLAAAGLAQNFAACLALSTVGIQRGHMALHARSVALSAGVPAADVDEVAQTMIKRGEVKVAMAEEAYRLLKRQREAPQAAEHLPIEAFAPGKVVLFGEHSVVYGQPGITAALDVGLRVRLTPDPEGPRTVQPHFKRAFDVAESDQDYTRLSQAVQAALAQSGLERAPLAIEIESDLVPGMGLGSSAAFSTALCRALRLYRGAAANGRFDSALFEEVQALERMFHGNPSGMDAAAVISGGVLWFRKGPPRELLPLKLERPVSGVICIVAPGARTIELVGQVRQQRELAQAGVDAILGEIGALTAEAGLTLAAGDLQRTGELMNDNHELLARLGVSTPELDRAAAWLRVHGALGAKLTGAGGGGAVLALMEPEQRAALWPELEARFPVVLPLNLGAEG